MSHASFSFGLWNFTPNSELFTPLEVGRAITPATSNGASSELFSEPPRRYSRLARLIGDDDIDHVSGIIHLFLRLLHLLLNPFYPRHVRGRNRGTGIPASQQLGFFLFELLITLSRVRQPLLPFPQPLLPLRFVRFVFALRS